MPINVERRTKKLCWTENLPGAVDAAVSQEVADGIADRGIVDVGGRAKVSNAKLQKRWSEQQKKKAGYVKQIFWPRAVRGSLINTYLEAINIGGPDAAGRELDTVVRGATEGNDLVAQGVGIDGAPAVRGLGAAVVGDGLLGHEGHSAEEHD